MGISASEDTAQLIAKCEAVLTQAANDIESEVGKDKAPEERGLAAECKQWLKENAYEHMTLVP